jgi:enoyl-CoA hydratase/carnithine racemase
MSGVIRQESGGPGVLVFTLDNPPMNPLGESMRARLIELLDQAAAAPDVRALVITGQGSAFCSGDDLKADAPAAGGKAGFGRLLEKLERCRQPIIAAVNGWCIGGGFELALCCDIRLASHQARFVSAGVNMGLMTSAYRLPRLIGESRAKAIALTGLPMDAAAAERCGLVTGLHANTDLMPAALAMAQRIASRAPLSVEATKVLASRACDLSREEAAEIQRSEIERLRASDDHREAIAALREKRDPVFRLK